VRGTRPVASLLFGAVGGPASLFSHVGRVRPVVGPGCKEYWKRAGKRTCRRLFEGAAENAGINAIVSREDHRMPHEG